jgi:hypothetical protein
VRGVTRQKEKADTKDGTSPQTNCIRSTYFPEKRVEDLNVEARKVFNVSVTITIPSVRAVAAIMASALRFSAVFPDRQAKIDLLNKLSA